MKIKRTSLIFRLAKLGGLPHHWEDDEPYTICEINHHLFFGILLFITLSSVILFSMIVMSIPLYYGIMWIFDHTIIFPPHDSDRGTLIEIGIVLWVFLMSIGSIKFISDWYERRTIAMWQDNLPPKEPSTISLHWKAFREKICFKVDIVD